MSVNIKQLDGTLKKVAGNTILLDATCAEVRSGSFSTELISADGYATVNVVFSTPMPDANYVAILNPRSGAWIKANYMVSDKTATGFTALCSNTYAAGGMPTQTVDYYAFRLVELDGYTALQNKVSNPDSTPTENSTNLVTSGGVYDAISSASKIFVNSESAWNELDAETKATYQVAIFTNQPNVNAVDSTDGSTTVVANKNLVFKGTLEEWEALTTAEKKTYDEALITNDMDTGEVVNGVTDGDMRAVTSNAVYDAIANVSEVKSVSIEKTTVAGITTGWSDGVDNAHRAYRNGKQVVMNIALQITGTFTGTAGWQKLFELPTSLLEPGESFAIPYMVSVNDGVDSTLLNGNLMYFDNGQTVNFRVMAQVILFVV